MKSKSQRGHWVQRFPCTVKLCKHMILGKKDKLIIKDLPDFIHSSLVIWFLSKGRTVVAPLLISIHLSKVTTALWLSRRVLQPPQNTGAHTFRKKSAWDTDLLHPSKLCTHWSTQESHWDSSTEKRAIMKTIQHWTAPSGITILCCAQPNGKSKRNDSKLLSRTKSGAEEGYFNSLLQRRLCRRWPLVQYVVCQSRPDL